MDNKYLKWVSSRGHTEAAIKTSLGAHTVKDGLVRCDKCDYRNLGPGYCSTALCADAEELINELERSLCNAKKPETSDGPADVLMPALSAGA